MSSNNEVEPYRLSVRGVEPFLVQLMRISAVRLGISQGDAVNSALGWWLVKGPGKEGLKSDGLTEELQILAKTQWWARI